jgi:hypothetical protein
MLLRIEVMHQLATAAGRRELAPPRRGAVSLASSDSLSLADRVQKRPLERMEGTGETTVGTLRQRAAGVGVPAGLIEGVRRDGDDDPSRSAHIAMVTASP